MWKARLRRFLGLRGNRQLVLTLSSFASVVAVAGACVSFSDMRNSRLHAEEHALEIETLQEVRSGLSEQEVQLQSKVANQRSGFVSADQADLFRDRIIALIRESNCRLRSVQPGESDSRRWMEDDSLLAGTELFDRRVEEPVRTPFELVSQSLNLQVSGTFEDTQTLLRKVQTLHKTFTTRTLSMQVVPEYGIQLDWDLLLFDLQPVAVSSDEW